MTVKVSGREGCNHTKYSAKYFTIANNIDFTPALFIINVWRILKNIIIEKLLAYISISERKTANSTNVDIIFGLWQWYEVYSGL